MMDFYTLNLCLFGEGGDGAAEGGASENASGGDVEVVYGIQPDQLDDEAANEEPEEQQPVDLNAQFEQMIKGEYKDAFAKRTQKLIDTRFRQAKEQEARLTALRPVLDALGSRYGIEANAPDMAERLMAAIDSDDSYYEDEADKLGLTVSQLREQRKMERENAQLRDALAERQRQEARDNVYSEWLRQGEALTAIYPEFDLKAESTGENAERFLSLLQNGIDMRTAYEVVHRDELITGAISYAVNTAQQRTVDNIRARGMRPRESANGASTAATRIVKADPAAWTDDDIDAAIRQSREGKRIQLGR